MKYLSKKITDYIMKADVISKESYDIYQYGFQLGLEILSYFIVTFGIGLYLHMIPEFIVFMSIFMLLRTYIGGVHLDTFAGCFVCSVTVQTSVLLIEKHYTFILPIAWLIIVSGSILILIAAPVENINRELDMDEKRHCKKVSIKIVISIVLFAASCTLAGGNDMVSLTASTILVVLISQYLGIVKYKVEKNRQI